MRQLGPSLFTEDYAFCQYNVAWHFIRDDVYDPWVSIGLYVTTNGFARCQYQFDYKYMEREFLKEVKQAGPMVSSTPEFLDAWRLRHQEMHNVITPVINYYSMETDPVTLLGDTFRFYIGEHGILLPQRYAMYTMMLRQRERYVAAVYRKRCWDIEGKAKMLNQLEKAGIAVTKTDWQ